MHFASCIDPDPSIDIVTDASGFSVRPASLDDAGVITEIVNDCIVAELGVPWTSLGETRDDLSAPERDPSSDDAIVVDAYGTPVGYLQLAGDSDASTELHSQVFVRPGCWGLGLSALLVRLGEERARAKLRRTPAKERLMLRVARFAHNQAAGRLFDSLGYAYARTVWMMRIELHEPPPRGGALAGAAIRTFDTERDARATHAALVEAFEDHWSDVMPSYEEWRHREIEGEGASFDPGLWFLAVDGDEIVGAACCRARTARDPDMAQVEVLGMRRSWRGRGIGLALLSAAFEELRRRRIPRAELSVDSENPTGATRLYERAGMHVAYAWELWEMELRPADDDDMDA